MNSLKLNKITKLCFGYEEIAKTLGISLASARVSANRYAKNGLLIRLKRNFYVLANRWNSFSQEEKFSLANLMQVPSYVSLMTALGFYEITTQIQRDFIESISIKRTKKFEAGNSIFNYVKINKNLYSDFSRDKGFFIATAEKAFLDAVYLKSLNRYNFDLSSIDFSRLEAAKVRALSRKFPKKVWRLIEENGYFKKT